MCHACILICSQVSVRFKSQSQLVLINMHAEVTCNRPGGYTLVACHSCEHPATDTHCHMLHLQGSPSVHATANATLCHPCCTPKEAVSSTQQRHALPSAALMCLKSVHLRPGGGPCLPTLQPAAPQALFNWYAPGCRIPWEVICCCCPRQQVQLGCLTVSQSW